MHLHLCRLAEHGLSTAGRKADLEERLQTFNATASQPAGAAAPLGIAVTGSATESSKPPGKGTRAPKSRQPLEGKLVKGGKRKNFVRLQLRVCSTSMSQAVPQKDMT